MVVQVCARTGLNVKFAVDCLTGNGWDLEKAVNNFNEVKVCLCSASLMFRALALASCIVFLVLVLRCNHDAAGAAYGLERVLI